MQRVHQDDLAGYLQEQGGFDVLSLPAIAQRDETHYLGDGRVKERLKGELLYPEHEPLAEARHSVALLLRQYPDMTVSSIISAVPMHVEVKARCAESLEAAGLPV